MYTKFCDIFQTKHEYASTHNRQNVIGYICSMAPEEVVYAAGFLPVRVMGSNKMQTVSDAYIPAIFCSHCRDILAQGLQGKYNYLKGLVHTTSCEKMRSAFDSWQRHVSGSNTYYLWMPQVLNKDAEETYFAEVCRFKQQFENDWQVSISDENLFQAITVYNENRRLMRKIYELTQKVPSPVSGKELVSMSLAGQIMDKAEHSIIVKEFIENVQQRDVDEDDEEARVMLIGNSSGGLELVQLLDSLGAKIVVDETCFGLRYFSEEINYTDNPLKAISQKYVTGMPCPVKDTSLPRKRIPFIVDLARRYNVQFAILVYPAFCDPHVYDNPLIHETLIEEGIKVLEIAEDFPLPVGQLRTRIEATLESVC